VNYEFEPDSTWPSPRRKLDNVNASRAILESKWKSLWNTMRADIFKAKARQKKWYDQNHMKAPELKAGDKVMLDRRNMITKYFCWSPIGDRDTLNALKYLLLQMRSKENTVTFLEK
jgi:hypothetical protein